MGALRITDVQKHHVADLFGKISSGWRPGMKSSEKPEKPTPIVANRMLANLSKLFTVAERKGLRPQATNPCKLVERNPETKGRERYLTLEEFGWVHQVLSDAPNWEDKDHPSHAYGKDLPIPTAYAIAAIGLLMYTGARLNEILRLSWPEVNRERRVFRIEDHKTSKRTGAKELPINSEALAILDSLEQLPTRHLKGEWVIQGHKHGSHFVGLQKVWERAYSGGLGFSSGFSF